MTVMITATALAKEMGIGKESIYEWARREDDPLPLRTAIGKKRSSSVVVSEFVEWWNRNSTLFKEVKR